MVRYNTPTNSDRLALVEMYFIGAAVLAVGAGLFFMYNDSKTMTPQALGATNCTLLQL